MQYGIELSGPVRALRNAPVAGGLASRLHDAWLCGRYGVGWNLLENPSSRRHFLECPSVLSPLQQKLVDDLDRDGIAFTQADALLGEAKGWQGVRDVASEFCCSPKTLAEIASAEAAVDQAKAGEETAYMVRHYPAVGRPKISADDPFLQMGLGREVLDVVNSYFRLWTRLIYFDLWRSIPIPASAHATVPRWHRDPEDRRKVRVYLYFSKVDSGAMEYAPGTAMLGPLGDRWGWRGPLERPPHPEEEELSRLVPRSSWVRLTGDAGTLIFCDTSGIHRGTLCRSGTRLLATWSYVTPASLHHRRYDLDGPLEGRAPSARFAVS